MFEVNNYNYLKKLNDNGYRMIDIRDPVSYNSGTILNAENIPFKNFVNEVMKMDKKSKLVLIEDGSSDVELAINYATQFGIADKNIVHANFYEMEKQIKLESSRNKSKKKNPA